MQIYLFLVVKTVYDILNSLIHFRLGFRLGPEQDVAVFRPDRLQLLQGEDVNALVRKLYPDAKRIASNLKNITCATFHPDDVEASADLDGTDLAVVDGRIGVCENGAVWVQQDVEQRAVYFISEALILLLDRKNLVNNMHEAYQKIDTGEYGYGVFISGPSKTADIEQALVMGAHGARELTVLLL